MHCVFALKFGKVLLNMLEDRFGRRFSYLRLSVTDVCNFRCNYCLPDGYQCDSDRDFLSVQEISTVSQAFAELGTSKIRITGGEPSLRRDLPDIISQVANTPGINEVAITTNGDKLPRNIQSWIDSGLTSLNVSIDSLDPRMFASITGHDKLEMVMQGIDMALEAGIPVKVNAVLMQHLKESGISEFLFWLKDKSVTLRFIELMQTGDNLTFFKQNHFAGTDLKQQLLENGWTRVIKSKTAGPAQEFQHPDYKGKIGLIMPYSKGFCDSCNRLRISSLGQLHLCLFAEQGIDLRQYMNSGDVAGLKQALVELLGQKEASHWLDEGFTGATKHLAMLGG